jgi:hypothetical protein
MHPPLFTASPPTTLTEALVSFAPPTTSRAGVAPVADEFTYTPQDDVVTFTPLDRFNVFPVVPRIYIQLLLTAPAVAVIAAVAIALLLKRPPAPPGAPKKGVVASAIRTVAQ